MFKLFHMLPVLPLYNKPNSCRAYAIFSGQPGISSTARRVALANFSHLRRSKARAGVTFAPGLPLLAHHVVNIVLTGAEKQMRRVATRPIIAGVTHHQRGINRAMGKFVGESVRGYILTTDPKACVAVRMESTSPGPARIHPPRLIHFCPEALNGRPAVAVPLKKTLWLPLNITKLSISTGGKARGLPTTARTQSRGICRGHRLGFTALMPVDEAARLPLDQAKATIRPTRGGSGLPAPTVTEAIWYTHSAETPITSGGHARGRSQRRPGFFMPNYTRLGTNLHAIDPILARWEPAFTAALDAAAEIANNT